MVINMIDICKIITLLFLSIMIKCTELYVVDPRAIFDTNSRLALEISRGVEVYVGE